MKRCGCQIQIWETTAHLKVTINHGPLSLVVRCTRPAGQPQSNKPLRGAQPLASLHLPAWTCRFIWACRQTMLYVLLIIFMCDFDWRRHVTYPAPVTLVNVQSILEQAYSCKTSVSLLYNYANMPPFSPHLPLSNQSSHKRPLQCFNYSNQSKVLHYHQVCSIWGKSDSKDKRPVEIWSQKHSWLLREYWTPKPYEFMFEIIFFFCALHQEGTIPIH